MGEDFGHVPLPTDHLFRVLDSVSDAVVTTTTERVITHLNRAAERITGIARWRAVGRRCCDVLRCEANGAEERCPFTRALRTGRPAHGWPTVLHAPAGEPLAVYVSVELLRNWAGEIVGGVHAIQCRASDAARSAEPILEAPVAAGNGLRALEHVQRRVIAEVLERHHWNRSTASVELGMSRTTLWRKMRKLEIRPQHTPSES